MEPLINLVHRAVVAFKQNEHQTVVLLLQNAFEYIDALDYHAIDEQIFNSN